MKKYYILALIIMIAISSVTILPIGKVRAESDFDMDCKSFVLVDANSGEKLMSRNETDTMPIASIVKLMTLNILFGEIDAGNISLDDDVQVSSYASSMGGSQLFLDAHSTHKLRDLVRSIVVASANDSSVVVAELIAGSESEFVKRMNTKAAALGMNSTKFVDCNGLSDDGYSCASDIAILSRATLENPIYLEFSHIWDEQYTHPTGRVTQVTNTNRLIRTMNGCIAGKTGSTESAGFCLTNMAERNDLKLLAVVLGSKSSVDRFANTSALLDYGFANYKVEKILSTDIAFDTIENNRYIPSRIEIYPEKDYGKVVKKGSQLNYDNIRVVPNICLNDRSIGENSIIGSADIYDSNELIGSVNLVVKTNIVKKGYANYITDVISNW